MIKNRYYGWALRDGGFVWRPINPHDGTLAHRRALAQAAKRPASPRSAVSFSMAAYRALEHEHGLRAFWQTYMEMAPHDP
jgi:hypothetical protein